MAVLILFGAFVGAEERKSKKVEPQKCRPAQKVELWEKQWL